MMKNSMKNIERAEVCEALKRIRHMRPEFRKRSKFVAASGLHPGTIIDTESGRILPSLETMSKWVHACGLTLGEFCASLEGVETPREFEIGPEHRHAVGLLLEILGNAPDEARDWLIGNLETFHRAYCRLKSKRRSK